MAPIAPTEEYIACLHSLAEPLEVLTKHGFICKQLDEGELLGQRRCQGCHRTMSKIDRMRQHLQNESEPKVVVKRNTSRKRAFTDDEQLEHSTLPKRPTLREPPAMKETLSQKPRVSPFHAKANVPHITPLNGLLELPLPIMQRRVFPRSGFEGASSSMQDLPQELKKAPKFACRYHLGKCVNKVWTCCEQPKGTQPCAGAPEHIPTQQELHELTALHQCYPTPSLDQLDRLYLCEAVAIDCEMGTAVSGDSELIRVTVVDYFSGAILIDNYVEPDVPMLHLNTKYSGVTWADIRNARQQGTILQGKAHSRHALWNYVGPDTLIIGHAVINDIRALKWIHTAVVDSLITEQARVRAKEAEEAKLKEAEESTLKQEEERLKIEGLTNVAMQELAEMRAATETADENAPVRKTGTLSLKTLAKKYLDIDIQNKGKAGHDSLEDAMAARDIVHCNVLALMMG